MTSLGSCDRPNEGSYTYFQLHSGPTHEARRIKYACFACRRAFKFVERDDMDYTWGTPLLVRPRYDRLKHVRDAYRRLASKEPAGDPQKLEDVHRKLEVYMASVLDGRKGKAEAEADAEGDKEVLQEEELAELRKYAVDAWWTLLKPSCPSCSAPGREVPPTFTPPPQRDLHAWADLERTVETVQAFSETKEEIEDESVTEESRRIMRSLRGPEVMDERRARVRVLKEAVALGVRTSEEERRLAVIRGREPEKADKEDP